MSAVKPKYSIPQNIKNTIPSCKNPDDGALSKAGSSGTPPFRALEAD